jgi:hypothetical protein
MSRRRIDVSASQVVASTLAAVTGAVAASYLGVTGTIIGAAVMSVASTAGAAVYKHYLARSHERLRAAAVNIAPLAALNGRAARWAQPGEAAGRPAEDAASAPAGSAHAPGGPGRTAGDDAAPAAAAAPDKAVTEGWPTAASLPDNTVTEALPKIGDRGRDRRADLPVGQPANVRAGRPAGLAGRQPDGSAQTPLAGGYGPDWADRGQGFTGWAGTRNSRRRWLVLGGATLAAFLLAMACITVIELAAGKPLDSLVRGRSGSGTTVGTVVGGHPGHPASPARQQPSSPAPSSQPSGTPSPSRSPAPSPSSSPSSSPSPTSSPGPQSSSKGGAASRSP